MITHYDHMITDHAVFKHPHPEKNGIHPIVLVVILQVLK